MPADLEWRPDVGKKVEDFFKDSGYKDYLENAVSFNRKLNEERKMHLPYIDGQTGVAQRHYNSMRHKRERMPGTRPGQLYSYPQRHWKKKRYQYLRYFMQPRHVERDVSDTVSVGQAETQSANNVPTGCHNDDSNASSGNMKDEMSKSEWSYYEDLFPEGPEDPFNSDSDFEYEDNYTKKKNKAVGKRGAKAKGSGSGTGGTPKRRANADAVPDSEKPYHCQMCGIKYKTRPGLKYHIKHSHKEAAADLLLSIQPVHPPQPVEEFTHDAPSPSAQPPMGPSPMSQPVVSSGATFLDLSGSAYSGDGLMHGASMRPRRSGLDVMAPSQPYPPTAPLAPPPPQQQHLPPQHMPHPHLPQHFPPPPPPPTSHQSQHPIPPQLPPPLDEMQPSTAAHAPTTRSATRSEQQATGKKPSPSHGKERAAAINYCDFCLGDANENKKTQSAEELVSCAECGRSGHPTCLQFTDNMLVSIRKYPWQCIECKCCTLCGTSENDDQLLFCDDCDRGYHMYCLVPPIKDPPEGSWSCKLCIETFHS